MSWKPDAFPSIALKYAKAADVIQLFRLLASRAVDLAKMQNDLLNQIVQSRELREGKPVKLTTKQMRLMESYEEDADQAVIEMDRLASSMDDSALLASALSGIDLAIQLDEPTVKTCHRDDAPAVGRVLEFQRETKRLIEEFVAASGLSGNVKSIWHGKSITTRK
ncbi:MAG: hypothetical protein U1G08_07085 [Verrucomicrobiota bacterium]